MVEEFNTPEEEKKNAGWIGIICSALFPIVGIILYFAKNNSVKNPTAYLYAALVGFALGLMSRLI